MAAFVGSVAAFTVLAILLIALVERVVRPASLPRALVEQRVLPKVLARPVSVAVMAAEGTLAALGALGIVLGMGTGEGGTTLLRVSLGAAAALFCLYAGYSQYLVATRDGVPCGCAGGADAPVNRWVVRRAALLAVLALAGLALAPQATGLAAATGQFAVALIAALTFAALLWHLPNAMEDPVEALVNRERQLLLRRIRGGQVHEL